MKDEGEEDTATLLLNVKPVWGFPFAVHEGLIYGLRSQWKLGFARVKGFSPMKEVCSEGRGESLHHSDAEDES